MPLRELTRSERQSVQNASLLIRRAGYDEKANLLDNLQNDAERDGVVVDTDMPPSVAGYTYRDKRQQIALNPNLLSGRTPTHVVGPTSPQIIGLAGTLHHELNHILCRDEIGAFNGEKVFYERINENMGRAFPGGLTEEERARIEAEKKRWHDDANRVADAIAQIGGEGYGGRPMPKGPERPGRPFPPTPTPGVEPGGTQPSGTRPGRQFPPAQTEPEGGLYAMPPSKYNSILLFDVANCLLTIHKRTGQFPPSGNRNLADALRNAGFDVSQYLNSEGEIVSDDGRRIIYRNPGVFDAFGFPDLFVPRHGCDPDAPGATEEALVEEFAHYRRR
jgi:hypothetical protein